MTPPVLPQATEPKSQQQDLPIHSPQRGLQALSHGGTAIPGIPTFSSPELKRQWQLEHMACTFRIWARAGYTEGLSGHISVRDPEHTNAFWTNPLGIHFGLLKASDMVLVALDGRVLGTYAGGRLTLDSGGARPVNAAGFLIHAAVHRGRADVHAVCHAHTRHGKAWGAFGRPLEMLTQDVCKFYKAHGVYARYGGVVLAEEEGEAVARALGGGKAAILMNHGLLSVGGTVDEAAYLFGCLERSCGVQLAVEAAVRDGLEKKIICDEEAAYNFAVESEAEILYCEFQPEYEYEDFLCGGDFKK